MLRSLRDGDLTNPNKGGFSTVFSTTIGNSAEAEWYCVKRKWNLETLSHLENKIAEKIAITENCNKEKKLRSLRVRQKSVTT